MEPTLDRDNDKNTVVSLREIAEEKIKVPDLIESAVYKLRKHIEQTDDTAEDDEEIGDDFANLYKGEISKSGVPILPSKRARKIPEKIQVFKEDLAEFQEERVVPENTEKNTEDQSTEVSLDEMKEEEGVPRISFDYMWQKSEEGKAEKIDSLPILVSFESAVKWVSANMVPAKGVEGYAVPAIGREIDLA